MSNTSVSSSWVEEAQAELVRLRAQVAEFERLVPQLRFEIEAQKERAKEAEATCDALRAEVERLKGELEDARAAWSAESLRAGSAAVGAEPAGRIAQMPPMAREHEEQLERDFAETDHPACCECAWCSDDDFIP